MSIMKRLSILRALLLLPTCCLFLTGCPGPDKSETQHPATVEVALQDGELNFKTFRPKSQPGFDVSITKEGTFRHEFGDMSTWEGKVKPTADGGFECTAEVDYPQLASFPDTKLHVQLHSSISDGKIRLQDAKPDESGGRP